MLSDMSACVCTFFWCWTSKRRDLTVGEVSIIFERWNASMLQHVSVDITISGLSADSSCKAFAKALQLQSNDRPWRTVDNAIHLRIHAVASVSLTTPEGAPSIDLACAERAGKTQVPDQRSVALQDTLVSAEFIQSLIPQPYSAQLFRLVLVGASSRCPASPFLLHLSCCHCS